MDRNPLALSAVSSFRMAKELIDECIIRCSRNTNGNAEALHDSRNEGSGDGLRNGKKRKCSSVDEILCDWVGKVSELEEHENSCLFSRVSCTFRSFGCKNMVVRSELQDHERRCNFRTLSCEHCSTSFVYQKLNAHKPLCPDRPTKCPSTGCGAIMKQCELQEHNRLECMFNFTNCVYCVKPFLAKSIADHLPICPLRTIPCENGCGMPVRFDRMAIHRARCPYEEICCPYRTIVDCCFTHLRCHRNKHAEDPKVHFKALMKVVTDLRDENNELKDRISAIERTLLSKQDK